MDIVRGATLLKRNPDCTLIIILLKFYMWFIHSLYCFVARTIILIKNDNTLGIDILIIYKAATLKLQIRNISKSARI